MTENKKLGLFSLIMMIFTSVYGFTNITRSFYLMGYAAIPWYIISGLAFFLPFAFIIAEYGAAFKDAEGGIYTWMSASSGPKYAFLVTFMWYASYVIWMVNVGSGIWIVLSNAIFGTDRTQTWSLFGLNYTQTLGVLAILWILAVTFLSSRGLEKIKKITSVGGMAVMLINVFLWVGGILIFILNKGNFQEAITAQGFIKAPNPDYLSGVRIMSFIVYAIFAYGGIEVIGGLVDQTDRPDVTFPKGVAIASIIITVGYAVGILIMGVFTNWQFTFTQFADFDITLGNVSYVAMNQMGYQLGLAFGASEAAARSWGLWVSRYMGTSMFLALTGAFFTLIYSPLKQLIGGTPKELWPKSWTVEKNGIYVNAMKFQAIVVIIMIAIVAFGGENAKKFFEILVAMTNLSMTLPYFFIAYSFIKFKENDKIAKPFVKFKTVSSAKIAVYVVCFLVAIANLFTVIEPVITSGDWLTSIMSFAGPLVFAIFANYLYSKYEKNYLHK